MKQVDSYAPMGPSLYNIATFFQCINSFHSKRAPSCPYSHLNISTQQFLPLQSWKLLLWM